MTLFNVESINSSVDVQSALHQVNLAISIEVSFWVFIVRTTTPSYKSLTKLIEIKLWIESKE